MSNEINERLFCYDSPMIEQKITSPEIVDRVAEVVASYAGTDAELSRAVGVSKTTIHNWRNKKSADFRTQNLSSLAAATGYAFAYLAYGEGSEEKGEVKEGLTGYVCPAGYACENKNERDLLRFFRALEPEFQEKLLKDAHIYSTWSRTGDTDKEYAFHKVISAIQNDQRLGDMTIDQLLDSLKK